MGGSLGGLLGSAVGFVVGGPAGAAIGGSIGGAAGNAADPPDVPKPKPKPKPEPRQAQRAVEPAPNVESAPTGPDKVEQVQARRQRTGQRRAAGARARTVLAGSSEESLGRRTVLGG